MGGLLVAAERPALDCWAVPIKSGAALGVGLQVWTQSGDRSRRGEQGGAAPCSEANAEPRP